MLASLYLYVLYPVYMQELQLRACVRERKCARERGGVGGKAEKEIRRIIRDLLFQRFKPAGKSRPNFNTWDSSNCISKKHITFYNLEIFIFFKNYK